MPSKSIHTRSGRSATPDSPVASAESSIPSTPPTYLIDDDEQLELGPPALKRSKHAQNAGRNGKGNGPTGSSGASVSRGGNTRISPAKHWCFTWNNPPPNGDSVLEEGFQGANNRWVWQDEDEGTPHKQGYVFFAKKIRPFYKNTDGDVVSTLGLDTKMHWEKCKSPVDAIRYCSDPGKRAGDGNLVVHRIQVPRHVHIITTEELYDFQKLVVDIVKTDPDQRTIYWLWEPTGSVGKSSLARYHD